MGILAPVGPHLNPPIIKEKHEGSLVKQKKMRLERKFRSLKPSKAILIPTGCSRSSVRT